MLLSVDTNGLAHAAAPLALFIWLEGTSQSCMQVQHLFHAWDTDGDGRLHAEELLEGAGMDACSAYGSYTHAV